MTQPQIFAAWQEAPAYPDPDTFTADMLLSAAFEDIGNLTPELLERLANIYTTATQPAATFVRRCGSQTAVSEATLTPLRTVSHWCTTGKIPANLRWLLANFYGLI